jgi:hypothetical protein
MRDASIHPVREPAPEARALRLGLAALVLASLLTAGCEPYRIEYRERPAWYSKMADGPLPNRVQLDDGTVLLFNVDPDDAAAKRASNDDDEPPPFRLRQEQEDGTVTLNAILPEHVIANTLNCMRGEEYDLLWDQGLAERTRLAYAAEGQGREEFVEFCREHRTELARTLNRMLMGFLSNDVTVEPEGDGVVVCRFWPHIAQQFRFKNVAIVHEGFQQKLLLIY